MGFYIEVPERLQKAKQLEDLYPVVAYSPSAFHPPDDDTLVCVVENPGMGFDAIGIVYDEAEFIRFGGAGTRPDDTRAKQWYLLDTAIVEKLCPRWAECKGRERE